MGSSILTKLAFDHLDDSKPNVGEYSWQFFEQPILPYITQPTLIIDEKNSVCKRIGMLIRQQLQEIGIKTTFVLYSNEDVINENFLIEKKAQAYIKLFLVGVDPSQTKEDWFLGEKKYKNSIWAYENKEVNELFELGDTLVNPKRRRLIYKKINEIIAEDQPACFLYYPYFFHAVSNRISNSKELFSVLMPFYTVKDWYINQEF